MKFKRRFAFVSLAFTFLFLGFPPAEATTMIYRTLQELTEMSDAVVRGTIITRHTFWSDEGTLFTDWQVQIDEVIGGQAPATITLRQMGGEIDGMRMHIPGDAMFTEGEHVVLFVREVESIHYLTLMGQAKLEVSLQGRSGAGPLLEMGDTVDLEAIDATLVRDLTDMAFYRWSESGGELYQMGSEMISLSDLRRMGAAP